MAWKNDKFWEEYPQPAPPSACWVPYPRPRQRLRIKATSAWLAEGATGFSIIGFWLFCVLTPDPESPWLAIPFLPTILVVWTALFHSVIPALFVRYHLLDASIKPRGERRPLRRFDLISRVASDPASLEKLGETYWRRTPFGMHWAVPYWKFNWYLCWLILPLVLFLPVFADIGVYSYFIRLALVTATMTFVALMRRRFVPSQPRSEYNVGCPPPDDSDRLPYDQVRTATLHWDRLLQREYLLLEHDSGHMRYYNFTGDPLYLLRLWKQRMPDAELHVSPVGI